MAYSKPTIPDIKINNIDGHLRFIPSEENLSVFVQLDPADSPKGNDWVVVLANFLALVAHPL